MRKKRPPNWENFDFWVLISALFGLCIAVAVFLGLRQFLFDAQSDIGDIITATATVLGGLTIGGVAVMQYRKHKWSEYQAKLDEDSRTGQRLSQAIEHLGNENLHIRLGAIYEFKNLAEDSPRNKENIMRILIAFIKSYQKKEGEEVPQDVEAAARTLSQLARELIEATAVRIPIVTKFIAKYRSAKLMRYITKFLPKKLKYYMDSLWFTVRPSEIVFIAAAEISKLEIEGIFQWSHLKTNYLDLSQIVLKGADLSGANFKRTRLEYAQLKQVTGMGHINFEEVDLSFANFEDANLEYVNFRNVNLTCASLKGAIFRICNLNDANFTFTNLEGVDLRDAELVHPLNLSQAKIDKKTCFATGIRLKYFRVEEPAHDEMRAWQISQTRIW